MAVYARNTENIEVIKTLLKRNADPNIQNSFKDTALHRAIIEVYLYRGLVDIKKYIEIITMLLNHGADLNIKNNDGYTALHNAALTGVEDIIVLLLKYGADIDARNSNNRTPYDLAVQRKFDNILPYLSIGRLTKGAK